MRPPRTFKKAEIVADHFNLSLECFLRAFEIDSEEDSKKRKKFESLDKTDTDALLDFYEDVDSRGLLEKQVLKAAVESTDDIEVLCDIADKADQQPEIEKMALLKALDQSNQEKDIKRVLSTSEEWSMVGIAAIRKLVRITN